MARWTLWLLFVATAACGRPDSDREDGAADDSPLGGPPLGGVDARDVQPLDTGAWVASPAPAPRGAMPGTAPGPTTGPTPDGWTRGASRGGSNAAIATLRAVRSARQDGYDRVVFEFDSLVPGYRIDYVDSPHYECGSGEAVRVAGDAWLEIALEPANAHTAAGQPTAPRRIDDLPGDNLRELRRICDFEAHVNWVLGVGSPNPYRAIVLSGPPRLVVDVRN